MNNAVLLYNEFSDMDYLNYKENYEDDIEYIETLMKEHGVEGARQILKDYFETY